ncbi:MAG TPA: NAD(P)/FAD-dependent oxidoreductase, partial [Vicinamibacteria bacterium]|nr:NAD(P)/FAD-dependent oxidoreductase [Vicinamibacteria bacterium]
MKRVVIIGGGPAGLTAAYALMKAGVSSVVLEQDTQVGGHARTVAYKGYLFDVGGHRFFTKIPEVQAIWREVMEDRFLRVRRLSRILYRGSFFHYPLKPFEALWKLGLFESAWVILSYLRKQLFPLRPEDNLESWMSNRFGRRLFLMFFKTYTEKVWGLPCTEIRAEWGAQRIKTLTLGSAILSSLLPGRERPRSLVEEFRYPERGPGMLWERMAVILGRGGHEVRLERRVVGIRRTAFRVDAVVTRHGATEEVVEGTDFIASMPLPELVLGLDPPAPPEIQDAARALRYRDFITVALMIRKADLFPDNWIYIHTPEVLVGRIQNFRNWSAAMVPEPGTTCLGLEYFCNEGDWLWTTPDARLVEIARAEIGKLGFASEGDVFDAAVVRQKKAYPVYDPAYRRHLDRLRDYLLDFENLQMVGRNGLHKYNNQDHAMLTALLAVRNVLGEKHDVWAVNTEDEYHE